LHIVKVESVTPVARGEIRSPYAGRVGTNDSRIISFARLTRAPRIRFQFSFNANVRHADHLCVQSRVFASYFVREYYIHTHTYTKSRRRHVAAATVRGTPLVKRKTLTLWNSPRLYSKTWSSPFPLVCGDNETQHNRSIRLCDHYYYSYFEVSWLSTYCLPADIKNTNRRHSGNHALGDEL